MSDTIVVPRRFCGPPDSANGGYACGIVAGEVGNPAEVTLRRPPPLDTPLRVERDDSDVVEVFAGDDLVAEGRRGVADLAPPAPVAFEDAHRASSQSWIALQPDDHVFPTCFMCGPGREYPDGQRMFVAPVPGRDLAAAPWIPDATLPARAGRIAAEIVWAVLDCAGGIGAAYVDGEVEVGPPSVLGRFVADVQTTPRVGDECVALGWRIGQDGRKTFAGSALYDSGGELLAIARATWIALREPA
jgi:hypothetical protein